MRLAIRPEAISLHNGSAANNHLAGTLVSVVFLGSIVRLVVRCGGVELITDVFNNPRLALPEPGRR